jgi:hypothetical protein
MRDKRVSNVSLCFSSDACKIEGAVGIMACVLSLVRVVLPLLVYWLGLDALEQHHVAVTADL